MGPDLGMPTDSSKSMDPFHQFSMLGLVAGGLGEPGIAGRQRYRSAILVPIWVAADGTGNLFVADTMNHTIRKVVMITQVATTLAGTAGIYGSTDETGAAARFYRPNGWQRTEPGNLFVADGLNLTIRKVVVATGWLRRLPAPGMSGGTDGTARRRASIIRMGCSGRSGHLFVADSSNHTVRKVVVATGWSRRLPALQECQAALTFPRKSGQVGYA